MTVQGREAGAAALVDACAGLGVVLSGDAMLDRYGRGAARRIATKALPRSAPRCGW
ncbi:hypothetical protein [uncultured Jannaschia sp.]|uniref:hypothetical protein n=1 Tax=uncultured Jannaschia sp. TaxID=293347 RepID=UPI002612543F|nr:hypothetical protein [uncultured Jannaschia sp.]